MASASDAREAAGRTSLADLDSEFAKAVDTYKAGEFAKALSQFAALGERTQSPNVQLYIGYCNARLRRPSDAYRAFSLTLQRIEAAGGTQYEATRSAAKQQLLALDPQLSKLTISLVQAPANTVVRLDGKILDLAQLRARLTIEPGVHVIEAEAPGARSVVQSVTLEKGYAKTVALLLQARDGSETAMTASNPDSPSGHSGSNHSNLTTFGWAAAGLGAVGWGVFAVAGIRAKGVYDGLQAQCNIPCSDSSHRNDAESGRAWQTAANAGLSIGILGTLSAATLLIWGNTDNREKRASAGFQLGPGSAQLSYQGRF